MPGLLYAIIYKSSTRAVNRNLLVAGLNRRTEVARRSVCFAYSMCVHVCDLTVLQIGKREGVVICYRDVNPKPSENRSKVTGCHSLFHSTDFTDESVFSTDWTVFLSPLDQTVCIIQLFFMNMDLHMCNLKKGRKKNKGS